MPRYKRTAQKNTEIHQFDEQEIIPQQSQTKKNKIIKNQPAHADPSTSHRSTTTRLTPHKSQLKPPTDFIHLTRSKKASSQKLMSKTLNLSNRPLTAIIQLYRSIDHHSPHFGINKCWGSAKMACPIKGAIFFLPKEERKVFPYFLAPRPKRERPF